MRKAIKQFIQNFKKDERGLTLVELLAVVVILAIVGGIAFVVIGNVVENSKQDAHIANAQQIISAAELYQATGGDIDDFTGASPAALSTLETLQDEIISPWSKKNYLSDFSLTVDDEVIKVSFVATNNEDKGKCEFSAKSKSDLSKGRKVICGDEEE